MLKKQDNSQTFLERWHSSRTKLKRVRKLIESKESFSCPSCLSENVILDETNDATHYECLTCGMQGFIDD
jgi:transcription elongation factor Elf1